MLVLPASSALVSFGSSSLITSHGVNVLAVALATASLLVGVARFVLTFRENIRILHFSEEEATTDALTGLGNRRALLADLEAVGRDSEGSSHMLLLFDLDGLKSYNDAFGHPAGDALLERLEANLAAAIDGAGTAYRLGGDEFCCPRARRGRQRTRARRSCRGGAQRARRARPRRMLRGVWARRRRRGARRAGWSGASLR